MNVIICQWINQYQYSSALYKRCLYFNTWKINSFQSGYHNGRLYWTLPPPNLACAITAAVAAIIDAYLCRTLRRERERKLRWWQLPVCLLPPHSLPPVNFSQTIDGIALKSNLHRRQLRLLYSNFGDGDLWHMGSWFKRIDPLQLSLVENISSAFFQSI